MGTAEEKGYTLCFPPGDFLGVVVAPMTGRLGRVSLRARIASAFCSGVKNGSFSCQSNKNIRKEKKKRERKEKEKEKRRKGRCLDEKTNIALDDVIVFPDGLEQGIVHLLALEQELLDPITILRQKNRKETNVRVN